MTMDKTKLATLASLTGVHTDKLIEQISRLPRKERAVVLDNLPAVCDAPHDAGKALTLTLALIKATARSESVRRSNRRSETRRRITVGCKVSFAVYDKCVACAATRGLSLNAWIRHAVFDALRNEREPDDEGDVDDDGSGYFLPWRGCAL